MRSAASAGDPVDAAVGKAGDEQGAVGNGSEPRRPAREQGAQYQAETAKAGAESALTDFLPQNSSDIYNLAILALADFDQQLWIIDLVFGALAPAGGVGGCVKPVYSPARTPSDALLDQGAQPHKPAKLSIERPID